MAKSGQKINLGALLVVGLGLAMLFVVVNITSSKTTKQNLNSNAQEYNPVINPADFTTNITNKYSAWPIGKKMVYEQRNKDGLEKIEITVTGETKVVMGVTTLVYFDKVWLNGVILEDTRDYLAQDRQGNVWYFGEDVDNYEDGVLVDHEGSWLAGVDGALPGYWMKANPTVGETYRQEYRPGIAEDMAKVVSLNERVVVPDGNFTGCLKTYDFSPLIPDLQEHKYYCPQVGGMALEVDQVSKDKTKLIDVLFNGVSSD